MLRHLVVIPAFNEEAALPRTLAGLQSLPDNFELLVVDDGSRDQTRSIALGAKQTSRLNVHIVSLPLNSGIGAAVQTGYLFAHREQRYHCVIQFDGDGQHDPQAIPALVDECVSRGIDLCIGSRFLVDSPSGFQSTPIRRAGIRFFSWLISRLSGQRVTDPTSGLRCAGPAAWQEFVGLYPEDFPEPESVLSCLRLGLRVREIPVRMYARQSGLSSIRFLVAGYYMAKVTLALFIERLRTGRLQQG